MTISNNSELDFSGNIERFSGFAALYDQYRPSPPAALAELLTRLAGVTMLGLVVDLGSGTGLSSRYWAGRAREVVGIEPSGDMRQQAAAQTQAGNVTYREGFSHATGLPEACADLVTCAQSLHWMDPQATFEEAKRILRAGGVFAAFDYDWPPITGSWQADQAYEACLHHARQMERAHPSGAKVMQWPKESHLERMAASGCFRYTREIVLHHTDQGSAERLYGLALSQGGVMTLLKQGYSEAELGLERLKAAAEEHLGGQPRDWLWSARLRIGVR